MLMSNQFCSLPDSSCITLSPLCETAKLSQACFWCCLIRLSNISLCKNVFGFDFPFTLTKTHLHVHVLSYPLHEMCFASEAQRDQAEPHADDHPPEVPLQCTAADLTTMDLNLDRAMREFAAKLEILMSKCRTAELDEDSLGHISSLKDVARELGSQEFQKRVDNLCQQMEMAVQDNRMRSKTTDAGAWVIHTGKEPLSMYDAEM